MRRSVLTLSVPALLALAACAHAPGPAPARCPEGAAPVADAPMGDAPDAPPHPAAPDRGRRPSPFAARAAVPALQRLFAHHCPRGRPRWWVSTGPLDLIARAGYALEHAAEDKIALYVCARVDPAELGGDVDRGDRFAADPLLAPGRRAALADYARSGYSRGHQAPSADQTRSRERNDETFYLSNMTPQLQALNGGAWAQLEKRVRGWATQYGGAWVVTGPLFHEAAEEDPATADGVVEHAVIGPGRVAVPTHYFKVVVAEVGGELRAIAFVFPNAAPPKGAPLADAIVSIDAVEALSGLDLLPDLDAADEARLERAPAAMWP